MFHVPLFQDLCDTGYGHQTSTDRYGKSKKELVNQVRRLKKRGGIPPVFPNGWFAVLESQDLKVGQVRAVDALGEVWRSSQCDPALLRPRWMTCNHQTIHFSLADRRELGCIPHGTRQSRNLGRVLPSSGSPFGHRWQSRRQLYRVPIPRLAIPSPRRPVHSRSVRQKRWVSTIHSATNSGFPFAL